MPWYVGWCMTRQVSLNSTSCPCQLLWERSVPLINFLYLVHIGQRHPDGWQVPYHWKCIKIMHWHGLSNARKYGNLLVDNDDSLQYSFNTQILFYNGITWGAHTKYTSYFLLPSWEEAKTGMERKCWNNSMMLVDVTGCCMMWLGISWVMWVTTDDDI